MEREKKYQSIDRLADDLQWQHDLAGRNSMTWAFVFSVQSFQVLQRISAVQTRSFRLICSLFFILQSGVNCLRAPLPLRNCQLSLLVIRPKRTRKKVQSSTHFPLREPCCAVNLGLDSSLAETKSWAISLSPFSPSDLTNKHPFQPFSGPRFNRKRGWGARTRTGNEKEKKKSFHKAFKEFKTRLCVRPHI